MSVDVWAGCSGGQGDSVQLDVVPRRPTVQLVASSWVWLWICVYCQGCLGKQRYRFRHLHLLPYGPSGAPPPRPRDLVGCSDMKMIPQVTKYRNADYVFTGATVVGSAANNDTFVKFSKAILSGAHQVIAGDDADVMRFFVIAT